MGEGTGGQKLKSSGSLRLRAAPNLLSQKTKKGKKREIQEEQAIEERSDSPLSLYSEATGQSKEPNRDQGPVAKNSTNDEGRKERKKRAIKIRRKSKRDIGGKAPGEANVEVQQKGSAPWEDRKTKKDRSS